jgi:hypothetical protein
LGKRSFHFLNSFFSERFPVESHVISGKVEKLDVQPKKKSQLTDVAVMDATIISSFNSMELKKGVKQRPLQSVNVISLHTRMMPYSRQPFLDHVIHN